MLAEARLLMSSVPSTVRVAVIWVYSEAVAVLTLPQLTDLFHPANPSAGSVR